MNVKKNISGALNTILGIITNSESEKSKFHTELKSTKNVYSKKELDEAFFEAEVRKSRAIALLNDIQNC